MHKTRIFGNSLIALVFCACCSVGARAAEICHTPEPQTLIAWFQSAYPRTDLHYSPKNSLIYHPIEVFQTERPRLNWIGLAWLSPEAGALFAARCDGRPIAGRATGAIGKLAAGPVLPGLGQTVMLQYVGRETDNCVHDAVEIAALHNGEIISLWRHGFNQGLNVPGSGKAPKMFVSEIYAVSYSGHGLTVRISGTRAVYPYLKNGSQSPRPSTARTLNTETYHWDPKTLRFLPQQRYRQPAPCHINDWHGTK